jgi:hypothetical protein
MELVAISLLKKYWVFVAQRGFVIIRQMFRNKFLLFLRMLPNVDGYYSGWSQLPSSDGTTQQFPSRAEQLLASAFKPKRFKNQVGLKSRQS